jgi:dTMP kinase
MSTTSGGAGRERRGLFITLEGPDGSGKTTQAKLLAERLRREGYDVLETVEPGGTRIGQQIRSILLNAANQELRPTTELLLMFAARAQNVDEWIVPALDQGRIVVCDRFTDSSIAYQGAGRGLGTETVLAVDRIACRGLVPDLTVCVDIDTETGLERAHSRNRTNRGASESRLDEQSLDFHQKARAAYYELARREPERFHMIDGSGSPEEVAERVWQLVAPVVSARSLK